MDIRFAEVKDATQLKTIDHHISESKLIQKIQQNEVIIATNENQIIGFLRFNYFWDQIPYMNMLWIIKENRGKGTGSALVKFWETQMRALSHQMILTSTMENETAQHFFRKLNYVDCGNLRIEKEGSEIIFKKEFKDPEEVKKQPDIK